MLIKLVNCLNSSCYKALQTTRQHMSPTTWRNINRKRRSFDTTTCVTNTWGRCQLRAKCIILSPGSMGTRFPAMHLKYPVFLSWLNSFLVRQCFKRSHKLKFIVNRLSYGSRCQGSTYEGTLIDTRQGLISDGLLTRLTSVNRYIWCVIPNIYQLTSDLIVSNFLPGFKSPTPSLYSLSFNCLYLSHCKWNGKYQHPWKFYFDRRMLFKR